MIILKKVIMQWTKLTANSYYVKSMDKRMEYLQKIHEFCSRGKPIFHLDETVRCSQQIKALTKRGQKFVVFSLFQFYIVVFHKFLLY